MRAEAWRGLILPSLVPLPGGARLGINDGEEMPRTNHPFEFSLRERHFTWPADAVFHHMQIQSMPEIISARIKTRGLFEWTIENILEASSLWDGGKTKRQIAAHFKVTRDAIVGMMFRNRALFAKRG